MIHNQITRHDGFIMSFLNFFSFNSLVKQCFIYAHTIGILYVVNYLRYEYLLLTIVLKWRISSVFV
jgi:hypothetical protein